MTMMSGHLMGNRQPQMVSYHGKLLNKLSYHRWFGLPWNWYNVIVLRCWRTVPVRFLLTRVSSWFPGCLQRLAEPAMNGMLYQKQVSRAGTSDYIPQYLWDVITCHCRDTSFRRARSRHQGQGQVITSHSICGMQLHVPCHWYLLLA